MTTIILTVLAVILAVFLPRFITSQDPAKDRILGSVRYTVRILCFAVAALVAASSSFVYVEKDQTGHLDKTVGLKSLKDGHILAINGEMGPQADVLPPGFHVRFLLRIFYNVKMEDVIEVPPGQYGFLYAKDGDPLRDGQTYADPFPPGTADKMANDAAYFLTNDGQKGSQTTVLTPGKYRLNHFLWRVELGDATDIPKGFVGVVKSNVHSRVDFGSLISDKPVDCTARSDAAGPAAEARPSRRQDGTKPRVHGRGGSRAGLHRRNDFLGLSFPGSPARRDGERGPDVDLRHGHPSARQAEG